MNRLHIWHRHDGYNAVCMKCGTRERARPTAYGDCIVQWRLPDGTYLDNDGGLPAPPCQPPEGSQPA